MRTIRLRAWQRAALERFRTSDSQDFLAVATPGAGKTTFALLAAREALTAQSGRLVVVAPTAHLKTQWAAAATRFDLHLDPEWSPSAGLLPADMHGIVTTYQQVATSAEAIAGIARGGLVILDEVHHAGDERAWGTSVLTAFADARRRLALSGTPFRSDTQAIPFVRYEHDLATPDIEFGYGDALADGDVVRPVYFPRIDGHMEWSGADGSLVSASFHDALDRSRTSERLRAALSIDGEWLPTVLRAAHDRLTLIRKSHPVAGGLVIAMDQDHARSIARLLRDRIGTVAEVVTSDDPEASDRIARFSDRTTPWIVAVRMVSEGVDIPRLRVGVFATTTSTELFFRQAVGRLVRYTPGLVSQKAYFFIPDDPRLRAHAFTIIEQRRHCLRKPDPVEETEPDPNALDEVVRERPDEQLSLFSVISAIATDVQVHAPTLFDDEPDPEIPAADPDLEIALAPLPFAPLPVMTADGRMLTRREHKEHLRQANADLARDLVMRTGMPHAKVNSELNRMAGVAKVSEATVEQLERRLRMGEKWWQRLSMLTPSGGRAAR